MLSRRPHLLFFGLPQLLALCIVLATGPAAEAQAPPPLDLTITSSPQITSDQQARICNYAEYWTAVLANPDATTDQIKTAREELVRPIQNINVSVDFRFVYSKCVVPALEKAIAPDNIHRASNALLVLGQLGSDRAVDAVLYHCNPQNQPQWQIRQLAAMAGEELLKSRSLQPGKIVDAVKRLRDAAQREENPVILLRQFKAMNAADYRGSPADRTQLRSSFIDAFVAVANRAELSNELLEPIGHAVLMLRAKFISGEITQDEKITLSKQLGPALGKVLTALSTSWDSAQADENRKSTFGVVAASTEALLAIVDGVVRSGAARPETRLPHAWSQGNKAAFDANVAAWLDVLKQPTYAQR